MTDATANYCARVFPPTWRILGLRLVPFTLGHAHVLCSSTAWRPFESYEMTDQLFATGLFICSRPWRKALAGVENWRAQWFGVGLAIRGRLAKVDLAEKGSAFSEYLLFGSTGPKVRPIVESSPHRIQAQASARTLGAPALAQLRAFAQPFGGLDFNFAEAFWLWSVAEETAGHQRILNAEEQGFDDWCEAEEAKG